MRRRYTPRTPDARPTQPFDTAEEAWFWFARSQRIRAEGLRFDTSSATMTRPCDPDDIYRIAIDLFRRGRLRTEHLNILARFGLMERAPDLRCANELHAHHYWEEALMILANAFRRKDIVR